MEYKLINKTNKKNNSVKKAVLIVVTVVAIIAIGAGIYWFSIPKEGRNMLTFMAFSGDSYDNYEEYQVIDRNEKSLSPTSFDPNAAISAEGESNQNIMAITEMVKNEDSSMLKKGNVQSIGIDNYTGWHLIADEGASEGNNPFGPSPLSYYTAGVATNLHTQIIKAASVQNVVLDSIKVEVLNTFRWDEMLSEDGSGHLDVTTTNIIIESNASQEDVQKVIDIAINSWSAGEALRNETTIEPTLVINGDNWKEYRSKPGTSLSDVSVVDGLKMSSVTEVPRVPETIDLSEYVDEGMSFNIDSMSNMQFAIFAISESAGNSERPYLKKVTLSTPSEETWEIYSDEFMGEDDIPLAPTSLEYFTAGTALCLTSQTTLVSAMMDLDFTEYRVENQMDYTQKSIDTPEMVGTTDTAHSYILIESQESEERLNEFYNKSLALCFAGEGLKNATEMNTNIYLNNNKLN
jgi:uncharacterized OsmC-like protein